MQTAVSVLSIIAAILYALATVFQILSMRSDDYRFVAYKQALVIAGFFAQGFAFATLTWIANGALSTTASIVFIVSWGIAFAYLLFEGISKIRRFGVIAYPVIVVLMVISIVLRLA